MRSTCVMMEENNQKADSDNASKNVGSFVKIDSISIDLDDGGDKNYAGKCEHFSIRGYVSEVRRQNWKLCWPFALDDENNKFEEQTSSLPPLIAPRFRWWSCQSCLQEISSKGSPIKDCVSSYPNGSQSNDPFSQMPSLSNPAMHLPDIQQAPTANVVEKTKFDLNTSTEVNRDVDQLPLCSDKKEVLVADAHTGVMGHKNGIENDAAHEIPRLTFVPAQINPDVMQEKPKHDTDAEAKLEQNRPLGLCKNSCRKHDVTDVELATHMDMCKNSTKMYQTEKQISADEQHRKSKIASGTSVLACLHDESGNGVKGQINGFGSQVLDHCNTSSESVEILVGQSLQDHNNDKSSSLQRRKARKVRLLTELLCDNGDAKVDHISTEESPSNAIDNASAGQQMVSVPLGQVSLPENRREGLGNNKKRKFPQDEEPSSSELNSQSNINRKVKSFKGGEETANAIADSVLKEDDSGFYLQTGIKSSWSDCRIDEDSVTGKKKNKRNQIIDVPPPLVPTGENFLNQIPGEVGISSKGVDDNVCLREVKDVSASRGMGKTPMESSSKERKSSLFKKKSKMPQVEDGQAPQFPSNSDLLKKCPTMRNEEVMHSGPVTVSFQQAEDASAEIQPHLSFGRYLSRQRHKYNRKYTQVADGLPSLLSWKEGTPVDQNMRKNAETKYISDLSLPSNSAYPFFDKHGHGEVSGKLATYNFPVVNEKQKISTQLEEGRSSLLKQLDISGASNDQKTIKGKERSSVTRKRADDIVGNVSEQGASDDIPMEIVELMAKNQYERRLDTAESKKCMLETANEAVNNQIIYHNKIYGKEFRIFEETSKRKNCRAKNERKDITTARKNVRPSKQKSVDYFSTVNRDQFDIKHFGQKKSSSIEFPSIGSSRCSCAENCKWNGNMMGPGFFLSGMQMGACDTCQIDSRRKEDASHFDSSTITCHFPVRCKVPQNGASQPTNLDVLSNGPGLLHKGRNVDREHELKLFNRNATNLEKHNQKSVSENFSRRNAEYLFANKHNGIERQQNLMGSLDLYSNETIPAMHLLSLMDAGMQSGPAFETGGNSKFLKMVPPPDHNSKEYSLLDFGVHNKHSAAAKCPRDYYSKNPLTEKSHDFFPVNPGVGASTSSSHHNKGFERANEFMGQVSFSPRGKEKVQSSGTAAQNRGCKALNSMFASGGLGTDHNAIPVQSMPNGFLNAAGSMVLPLQLHTTEDLTEHKLKTPHTYGTFRPPKPSYESLVCSINRNPADFSMPDAGNEYMIRGEDLKFGQLRKRHGLTSAAQRKQQRNTKRTTEKEHARH
ncbi:Protein EMBRYONIC FLOWER [Parasponia andersonii]|uniref:Protein EMBRYONIC FLOWER n=1 Tax=Parasponia andersonii TaxID=3476 RepID=A0A2P5ALD4_PARAD|nr:Protein EMBRYONIC FLOWER [Parasponia andersonii]